MKTSAPYASRSASRAPASAWHLMKRFVLRRPGFPFAWLERLRMPCSIALAEQLLREQRFLQHLQGVFEQEIFPQVIEEESLIHRGKESFHCWYRLARQVRRGQALDTATIQSVQEYQGSSALLKWLTAWQSNALRRAQLYQDTHKAFQEEFRDSRRALYEQVITPDFQEATWLSNPAMYETGWQSYCRHWEADRRPGKMKHLERRFYTYLQRFCAKNETTSFFGPLNYGDFSGTSALDYHYLPYSIRQRSVFFAYSAVQALARSIADEPALRRYLCPRRDSLRPQPAQDQPGAELYALSDGKHSVLEMARYLHASLEETEESLERLSAQGLLHLDIPIPPALLDPLAYLIERLKAWSEHSEAAQRWLDILNWFQQSCLRFAHADLPERQAILAEVEQRYTELTGTNPRRGQGKMFQDRTLLYEECAGNITDLHLNEGQKLHIAAALTPIADLCTSYSQIYLDELRSAALALFQELSPAGEPILFTRFLAAWRRYYSSALTLPRTERFQQEFAELVARQCTGRVSRLSTEHLEPLLQPLRMPVTFSPDVFLAAPSQEAITQQRYQVVLGEVHHGLQPIGWMLKFADNPEEWQSEIARFLPQATATTLPANALFGRRMKAAPPEFAGPSVQISASSTRLHPLNLNQLMVERRQHELGLRAPGNTCSLLFYPPSYGVPEALYAPFACFSYPLMRAVPVRLGEHTPRIEINGTVYQRERWDLPLSALPVRNARGISLQLLLDLRAFRQLSGLPERVFVSTPEEPKPVYIDFQNYFALELLAHLASRSTSITFVEMYPVQEQLWLHDMRGEYCCELRLVMSASPSAQAVEGESMDA